MPLVLEAIDDEAGATAFHGIEAVATPIDHPGLVADPLDDIVGMLANPMPSFQTSFLLGRAGRELVATAFVGFPMDENAHVCHLNVTVAPDARRRGVGREAADLVFTRAREAGRTVAIWGAGAPLDGSSAGTRFSERLGATAALENVRRELQLGDLDHAALEERLRALLTGPGAAYELCRWSGRCPDHLAEGAAAILPRVMSDSPRGALDLRDEVWDVPRYREFEAMLAARRRTSLVTAAVERSSGQLVAFTDLNVPDADHRVAAQLGTVVEPDHRGHRLGLAVKIANLQALREAYPDAESVQTYNAGANEHMIAVNEAVGFRAVERQTTYQLTL